MGQADWQAYRGERIGLLAERGALRLHQVLPKAASGAPVLVFSSMGAENHRPEFLHSLFALRRPILLAVDRGAAWYAEPALAADLREVVGAALADLGAAEADAIGFSMGAYGALSQAGALPLRHVLALSPRFAADPGLIPDTRARPGLAALTGRMAFPTVAAGLGRAASAVIVHGQGQRDAAQAAAFHRAAAGPRVLHRLLPLCGHYTPRRLKMLGLFAPLVAAALDGDRARAAFLLALAGGAVEGSLAAAAGRGLTRLAEAGDRALLGWTGRAIGRDLREERDGT